MVSSREAGEGHWSGRWRGRTPTGVDHPLEGGGTTTTSTMYLDPLPLLRPLVAVMARGIRRNIDRAMTNLAERAGAP